MEETATGLYPEPVKSSTHPHILFNIHFNKSSCLCLGSLHWSLPFTFLDSILYAFSYSHAYFVSRLSHNPWFDHPIDIWSTVKIIKLLIKQFSPPICYFLRRFLTTKNFVGFTLNSTDIARISEVCTAVLLVYGWYKFEITKMGCPPIV